MAQQTSNTREELESWIDKTKDHLLCNIVLNSIIRILPRFLRLQEDSLFANVIVSVLFAVFLYLLSFLISFLFDTSVPFGNPIAALVSLLTVLSFSIVKGLHDSILPSAAEKNFAKKLLELDTIPNEKLTSVRDWWVSFLSLPRQIIFVSLLGILGVLTVHYFSLKTSMTIHYGSYVLILFCGVAISQGGYCAITIPRLSKAITNVPFPMFWLRPADSLWIKEASSVFTKLSLANAFIASCIMAGLFWPKPWKTSTTTVVASIWLLITLSVVLYSFFYPQYYLSKIIKAEKDTQMSNLQKKIKKGPFGRASEEEIKKLNELIKVYEQLANSRESAIDMQALLRLFFSLAVPILSFIGISIQIGTTLTNQLKNIHQP
ncbi:MAG TPA: hypothetical protein VFA21_06820 [Pyrinomonadaceae bacterium]|nr:hypothetical protein [Pyrinomonadaceae bacterium]